MRKLFGPYVLWVVKGRRAFLVAGGVNMVVGLTLGLYAPWYIALPMILLYVLGDLTTHASAFWNGLNAGAKAYKEMAHKRLNALDKLAEAIGDAISEIEKAEGGKGEEPRHTLH